MIAKELQIALAFTVGFIILMVSLIPEIILVTYDITKEPPLGLKIYTIIHMGLLIIMILYLNWTEPSIIYVFI